MRALAYLDRMSHDERTKRGRPRRWASIGEAAEYMHVGRSTIRGWVAEGLLPAYRVGPKILQVDLDDLDALRVRWQEDEDGGPEPASIGPARGA